MIINTTTAHGELRDALNKAYREAYFPSMPKPAWLFFWRYRGNIYFTQKRLRRDYENDLDACWREIYSVRGKAK